MRGMNISPSAFDARGALLVWSAAALLAWGTDVAHAQGYCVPEPNGKWCPGGTTIFTYEHPSLPASIRFTLEVTVIPEWNAVLGTIPAAPRLGITGLCDQDCSGNGRDDFPQDGIVFKFAPIPGTKCAVTTTFSDGHTPPGLPLLRKAIVVLNSNRNWAFLSATSVLRHEIGHALGMADTDSTCPPQLMYGSGCGPADEPIDGPAISGIECIYGDPEGGGCGNKFGLLAKALIPEGPGFTPVKGYLTTCDCGRYCPTLAGKSAFVQPDLVYELAINESGGPYTVFKTLADSEWTAERTYTFTFDRPYEEALIRMSVFDGGELIDVVNTHEPVDILPVSVSETLHEPINRGGSRAIPNPSRGMTYIEFRIARDEAVELRIYDIAGRSVATLVQGPLRAGLHRIPFDQRSVLGRKLESGIYLYSIRTENRFDKGKLLFVR